MALQDVTLPKRYKNGRVLFEQTLDAWRLAAQSGFATVNLNLTQLARDCFSTGYNFDNDGAANLTTSLQDQINDLATGATPITGTTSDSFSINTDGATAVLTTSALTALRTFTFPDITGTFVVTEGTQTVNGSKTFTSRLDVTLTSTQFRLGYTSGVVYSDFLVDASGNLTITPTGQTITAIGTGNQETQFIVKNTNGGTTASARFDAIDNTASGSQITMQSFSQGFSGTFVSTGINKAKLKALFDNSAAGVTNGLLIGTTQDIPLYFMTQGFERGRITGAGDTGFGTTTPRAKLDVLSTTEQIRQTYTDNSVYASHLVNSSGYYSNISTGGRYGFGTASPSVGFHIKVSGATTRGVRIEADVGNDPFLQFTDSAHGYVLFYDQSENDFAINYDDVIGTGTREVFRLNEQGELLLPAVDPPTANYANRNGIVKAWIYCATGGTTNNASYNVSSIADNGTGREEIFWDTNFSTSNYALATHSEDSGSDILVFSFSRATTSVELRTYDVSGASLVDSAIGVIAIGAQ